MPSRNGVGTLMTATSKPASVVGVARRHVPAGAESASRAVVGDVLDVGLARRQQLDPRRSDVETDDIEPDLDGPHRQRQADITLTDNHNLHVVRSRPHQPSLTSIISNTGSFRIRGGGRGRSRLIDNPIATQSQKAYRRRRCTSLTGT